MNRRVAALALLSKPSSADVTLVPTAPFRRRPETRDTVYGEITTAVRGQDDYASPVPVVLCNPAGSYVTQQGSYVTQRGPYVTQAAYHLTGNFSPRSRL